MTGRGTFVIPGIKKTPKTRLKNSFGELIKKIETLAASTNLQLLCNKSILNSYCPVSFNYGFISCPLGKTKP
ncbi:hypothetical protein EFY79_17365 [Hanamia caeni]|jgi:hypothetical protein|uniref:Uncharacterized protein n=1 Tax=Hanamia caeni TaxID=2294116 RepID=A0A3M9N8D2_9BACT|nr:hypothetical protein EFY79_17365 [Hanamia caeni]